MTVSQTQARRPDYFMLQNNTKHEEFMRLALDQARLAFDAAEVPIGALIVHADTGDIIAKAYNQTVKLADPTAHAEILAIREACRIIGAQRIPEYDLYVTLEPCPMCASAISFARIRHVYYGADDIKSGGFVSGPCLSQAPALHHKPAFTKGICAEESTVLLQTFFKARR